MPKVCQLEKKQQFYKINHSDTRTAGTPCLAVGLRQAGSGGPPHSPLASSVSFAFCVTLDYICNQKKSDHYRLKYRIKYISWYLNVKRTIICN